MGGEGGGGGGGGGGLPGPFLTVGKMCPNFLGKMPCLWSSMCKISHLSTFKGFQEEKLEIFPCGVFLSRVVHDYLSKCPNF